MKNIYGIIVLSLIIIFQAHASNHQGTLLLRQPDIQGNVVVFTYGQEIWKAELDNLNAKRITSFQGQAQNPKISPDGKWIAFTGQYNGNSDVYIVNVNGGMPKQLTWHPGADIVKGWSNDSQSVLFGSGRDQAPRAQSRFYQVKISGNTPTSLPMIRSQSGSYSDDSSQFVYQKVSPWDDGWRKYRGGQNNPLRIVNLKTLAEQSLPFNGEKVTNPIWHGDDVYYLSDIEDVVNVYKYNLVSKKTTKITSHNDYDVKGYGSDGTNIVYEQHGKLLLLSEGKTQALAITINADFPWAAASWNKVNEHIEAIAISPNGKRALFTARGEVFSVPAKHGDIRNLSKSSARETSAVWSADGQKIAWFSDESGEYRLVISDQHGQSRSEIKLREQGFYANLTWSHDSKKLTYTDEKQQYWLVDLDKERSTLIDQDTRVIVENLVKPIFSPDDNYIAYVKTEANFLRNVYVYSVKEKTSHLITSNMADNNAFAWDINGKYLYVTASTNFASKAPWLDLSIEGKALETYEIYAVLLAKDTPSPVPLKQEDEEAKSDKSNGEKDDDENDEKDGEIIVNIDFDNIINRLIPIPLDTGYYSNLTSTEQGLLYVATSSDGTYKLHMFDFKKQESALIKDNVQNYVVADDNNHVLAKQKGNWLLAGTPADLEKAEPLNVALNLWIDPKKEWRQKFHDAWRFQRDYFYVTNIHGANWNKVYKDYLPLVEHVNHPSDLTYLLDNIGAETSVGHSFTRNGKLPSIPKSTIGLLGIDVGIKGKYFVINKIYDGEQWNSQVTSNAPLASHKEKLNVGDFILAVDGVTLDSTQNFYQYFNGTKGKQTKLTIGINGSIQKPIELWVKPTGNEYELRMHAWIENNRRYVNEASNDQLAYVWVPDTTTEGYEYFNRYFFAQADKLGAVIDERFNHGGSIADYFIDVLNRKLSGYFNNTLKPGQPLTSPGSLINGPKVLLINEMAGSGGDMFPYLFRFHNIGKLIGKTTWGGLVGIWGVPALIDGGYITAPRSGFYDLNGQWKVENEGVAPDIDVDENLQLASQGIDSQLKRAVEVAMAELKNQKNNRQQPAPAEPIRAVTAAME
ncbi:PDZ domain-containing protein [Thalassotalea fonticola]|uniref:Tricorn protease homolog n=1 Tax=Thalassotalea fonticola TaxID=3065649 RepID=A0ABZ0GQD8_9GAMM|nr:PDZ domain-containing protein [Colwelliaceae bacterium S1-1]